MNEPTSWGFVGEDYFTTEATEVALLEELGFHVELLDKQDDRRRFVYRVTNTTGKTPMSLKDAVKAIFDPSLWADDVAEKCRFYAAALKRREAWVNRVMGLKAGGGR